MQKAQWSFYLLTVALTIFGSSCFSTPGSAPSSTTSTSTTSTVAVAENAGEKAVKIIFKTGDGGSFDSASLPATGTTIDTVDGGYEATAVYTMDNVKLIKGVSSLWPKWLSRFEIGISGSSNLGADNADCARFATNTESQPNCVDSLGGSFQCAVQNFFRVSEYDCMQNSLVTENGSYSDGVYLRAVINRSSEALGSSENLMAVLEYTAAGIQGTPTDITKCFTADGVAPQECSDLLWNAYLWDKDPATKPVPLSRFLMLIPPITSFSDDTSKTNTGLRMTRQIFIPLASNSSIQAFQLSRITSNQLYTVRNTTLLNRCSNGGVGSGNSPLCAGVVFYSITFYRI